VSHFVITENEDKRPLIERDSLNAIEWRKVRAYFLKERDDRKARDAQLREFIKRQAEDCLVMAKHDDLINPKNEAEIWLKALLLVEEEAKTT